MRGNLQQFPIIMGVLNVTPDSFSDGGDFVSLDNALRQAEALKAAGAHWIDVGGESTRPGATPLTVAQEIARTIPVIEALSQRGLGPLSIDTRQPAVMQSAVAVGAQLINDVNALQAPGALALAAKLQVPVCLMHKQGQPSSMQTRPQYQNVVLEVKQFLANRLQAARAAGIAAEHIVIDPGFGFGKTLEHNWQLLKGLAQLKSLGYPMLVGLSRKSMVGDILEVPPKARLVGSLTAAILAAVGGANLFRVHDVKETVQAMTLLKYFRDCPPCSQEEALNVVN